MAVGGRDLFTDDHIDPIGRAKATGNQCARDRIVIGDRDDPNIGLFSDVGQHLLDSRVPIAVGCMDMQIGLAPASNHRKLLLLRIARNLV